MQIDKHAVVTIDYTLTNDQGQVVDTSKNNQPLAYIHGTGSIIPGLEEALQGKSSGDEVEVSIPPEKAYGEHDEELKQVVPRDRFEGVEQLEPGMQFQAQTEGGVRIVTIAAIDGDDVTVDANHPLAGETLHFEVAVRDVREATSEEIEHGHVHEGETPH